ncbi:MAG TPA: hypothetical protein VJL57_02680 [Candidatus Paceibacterota bacterium]
MSETTMLNLIGVFGLVTLVFGMWLFRSGKTIEQKVPAADADSWLQPTPEINRTSLPFYNFQAHFEIWFLQLWKANATKPLAYVCIATGILLTSIFAITVFDLPTPW